MLFVWFLPVIIKTMDEWVGGLLNRLVEIMKILKSGFVTFRNYFSSSVKKKEIKKMFDFQCLFTSLNPPHPHFLCTHEPWKIGSDNWQRFYGLNTVVQIDIHGNTRLIPIIVVLVVTTNPTVQSLLALKTTKKSV